MRQTLRDERFARAPAMIVMGLMAFAIMIAMPAAACAAASGDGRNILKVGVQLEPPNLDPTKGAAAAVDEIVYANLFEGLTAIGPNGEVTPRLAERWRLSRDGRTYRFYLRKGVTFHDGSAFDAEDVKFTLERAAAPGSANAQRSLFEPITRIAIIDPYTIDIELAAPVGAFLTHLAWGDAVIVAPESADNNALHPIGTGPMKFSRWRKGVSVDLVRNEAYRGAPLLFDGVSFKIIPDPTAAFAALMSGEVDGFPNYPAPENLKQFQRMDRFNVVTGTSEGETILAINNKASPFNDIRVRRALSHAIDKQALIDGALFGYGAPIGSHFPPHHPSYEDLTGRYSYDLEKARALLAEAGYPDGFDASLKLPPPSYARRGGEVIAAQLALIGVRLRIENLEWAQWLEQVFTNGNYDLTIVSHTEPLDIDIYARDDYYFNYDNPDYKKLIASLAVAADERTRDQLFRRAQRIISEDAVNVFLLQGVKTAVWRKGVDGVWAHAPVQANDFTRVTRKGLALTGAAPRTGPLVMLVGWMLAATGFIGAGFLAWRAGAAYVARRLFAILLTLVVATLVIFVLTEVAPGDPALYMMGLNAEPAALDALRAELGLNSSAPARYVSWVSGLITGDFGVSYTYRSPVGELILERLAVSLPLALYAIFLTMAIAFPLGLAAARKRGGVVDRTVMGASQAAIAMPNFWLAILLVLIFAAGLQWFPVGGFPGWEAGLFTGLKALTLPALALAAPQAAILTRIIRSALLDTMNEDYIRTARAKGLSPRQVLKNHALRNASIPVLTILGLQFSFLLAGGVIIENVFYLPGLGRLVFQAITQRDLIVVEGVVFVLAFAAIMIAFLADLACAAADPRLRKGAAR